MKSTRIPDTFLPAIFGKCDNSRFLFNSDNRNRIWIDSHLAGHFSHIFTQITSTQVSPIFRVDKDMAANEVKKRPYWPPPCRREKTRTGRAAAARSGSFVNNYLKVALGFEA
jgi:hypothetical protein